MMGIGLKFLRWDEISFLFLWCSGYIGAKIGVPLSGTFTLLFHRYWIVLLIVAIIVTIRRQWALPNRWVLINGFLAHFLLLVVILKAFEHGMNAGAVALVAAMQPILTTLLADRFLGEKNNFWQWLGIVLGFLGVVVFVSGDSLRSDTSLWVYFLPIVAILSLTALTFLEKIRQNQGDSLPIFTALFWQALLTVSMLFPLAYIFEDFEAVWEMEFTFSVFWLALVVSVGAYAMMYYLIRTRETTRVSSLQYLVPGITMFIGFLVFGETMNMIGALGFVVSAIGFYAFYRGEQKHQISV